MQMVKMLKNLGDMDNSKWRQMMEGIQNDYSAIEDFEVLLFHQTVGMNLK